MIASIWSRPALPLTPSCPAPVRSPISPLNVSNWDVTSDTILATASLPPPNNPPSLLDTSRPMYFKPSKDKSKLATADEGRIWLLSSKYVASKLFAIPMPRCPLRITPNDARNDFSPCVVPIPCCRIASSMLGEKYVSCCMPCCGCWYMKDFVSDTPSTRLGTVGTRMLAKARMSFTDLTADLLALANCINLSSIVLLSAPFMLWSLSRATKGAWLTEGISLPSGSTTGVPSQFLSSWTISNMLALAVPWLPPFNEASVGKSTVLAKVAFWAGTYVLTCIVSTPEKSCVANARSVFESVSPTGTVTVRGKPPTGVPSALLCSAAVALLFRLTKSASLRAFLMPLTCRIEVNPLSRMYFSTDASLNIGLNPASALLVASWLSMFLAPCANMGRACLMYSAAPSPLFSDSITSGVSRAFIVDNCSAGESLLNPPKCLPLAALIVMFRLSRMDLPAVRLDALVDSIVPSVDTFTIVWLTASLFCSTVASEFSTVWPLGRVSCMSSVTAGVTTPTIFWFTVLPVPAYS